MNVGEELYYADGSGRNQPLLSLLCGVDFESAGNDMVCLACTYTCDTDRMMATACDYASLITYSWQESSRLSNIISVAKSRNVWTWAWFSTLLVIITKAIWVLCSVNLCDVFALTLTLSLFRCLLCSFSVNSVFFSLSKTPEVCSKNGQFSYRFLSFQFYITSPVILKVWIITPQNLLRSIICSVTTYVWPRIGNGVSFTAKLRPHLEQGRTLWRSQ